MALGARHIGLRLNEVRRRLLKLLAGVRIVAHQVLVTVVLLLGKGQGSLGLLDLLQGLVDAGFLGIELRVEIGDGGIGLGDLSLSLGNLGLGDRDLIVTRIDIDQRCCLGNELMSVTGTATTRLRPGR